MSLTFGPTCFADEVACGRCRAKVLIRNRSVGATVVCAGCGGTFSPSHDRVTRFGVTAAETAAGLVEVDPEVIRDLGQTLPGGAERGIIGVHNVNIDSMPTLPPPGEIRKEFPMDAATKESVLRYRAVVQDILAGRDKRLMLVTGPCSIHDEKAALEYAERLRRLSDEVGDRVFLVMRAMFAKPRTTVGWKGLVYDPDMDGGHDIGKGIRLSRRISLALAAIGLPIATEILDPFTIEFASDIMATGTLGARTVQSQPHREVGSGLSFPVGAKNTTEGNVRDAVDAVEAMNHPHHFFGIDADGRVSYVRSKGNPWAYVILRGGSSGPNYDAATVANTVSMLEERKLLPSVVIDASHGNSRKDYRLQPDVIRSVVEQRMAGNGHVIGAMLESNLFEGNQKVGPLHSLRYGVSVTDACLGWEDTRDLVLEIADSLSDVTVAA